MNMLYGILQKKGLFPGYGPLASCIFNVSNFLHLCFVMALCRDLWIKKKIK